MLTTEEMQFMQRCLDAVRAGTPGFRARRPQLQMIAAVARTLGHVGEPAHLRAQGQHLAVIEAGTGTGKTLAYLLPALVLAHMRGRRVIVSSSTVTLQEQLLLKDAPALAHLLPFEVSFAVAKSRRRFLCPARLADRLQPRKGRGARRGRRAGDFDAADVGDAQGREEAARIVWYGQFADAFAKRRWDGDRDAWPQAVPDAIWADVSTDRQGCLANLCPRYADCPYYLGRQAAADADLVIANHDLVLACAGRDAASTLPDLREALVVFDEAHGLPAKVVDHGASRHSVCGAGGWLSQAAQAARAARELLPARSGGEVTDPAGAAAVLRCALDALLDAVGRHCEFSGQQRVSRFAPGPLPTEIRTCGEAVREAARALAQDLAVLRRVLVRHAAEEPRSVQPHLASIGPSFAKLDGLAQTWDWMLMDAASDAPGDPAASARPDAAPVARWIERQAGTGGRDDFLVCASPLSGGSRLRTLLWDQVGAAVLTSATLRACGHFDMFLQDAGLANHAALAPLALASPFDHASRATLRIPRMDAHPRDVEAHTREVARCLPDLLARQRGSLVLFASARQMHAVHAALPVEVRDRILMQGACPRRELIARHRACIDGGGTSILFGLAALAEGVDLPGEYCTHVICAKLPFSAPDGPVEQARREWIEAQGRSAFLERSVPEVAIRLAQATGRLLRTDDDSGTVTVLDPRLGATHWGRMLLRGLPPFKLVIGDAPAGRPPPR